MEIFEGWPDPSASVCQVRVWFEFGDCLLSRTVERSIGAPSLPELVDAEEEVGRPSCGVVVAVVVVVVAAAAAQGAADMEMAALDIEGSHTLVASAQGLAHTYVHVDHGFVMTRLMLGNWIVEYGRLVVGMVFAAYGQPPLGRVFLVALVNLPTLVNGNSLVLGIGKRVPAEEKCPDTGVP